nr:glycosyltransferase family A protein [uncultured Ligilactobacillus sp.]
MTNEIIISLVIAIYNVKDEVISCLSSIHGQNAKNVEFLLIDDGSNDGTSEIVKKFLKDNNDIRFKYYKKNNGGISDTRNFGIEKANGKYIWFVDGDDQLASPKVLDDLIEIITKYKNLDVVHFNFRKINECHGDSPLSGELKFGVDTSKVYSGKIFLNEPYDSYVTHYIFKKQLLKNSDYKFDTNLISGEDTAYIAPVILSAKKIFIFDKVCYLYIVNSHSILQNMSKRKVVQRDAYKVSLNLFKWTIQENFPTNSTFERDIYKKYIRQTVGMCATDCDFKINKAELIKLTKGRSTDFKTLIRKYILLVLPNKGRLKKWVCSKIW